MNATDDYQYEKSRKDLAAGILEQAVLDLRRFQRATSEVGREFYLDAYRWVISNDCSWPFSFSNICQVLNLAPETIRKEMLSDLSLGTVDCWSRHCGRDVRRFQIFLNPVFTNKHTANTTEAGALVHAKHQTKRRVSGKLTRSSHDKRHGKLNYSIFAPSLRVARNADFACGRRIFVSDVKKQDYCDHQLLLDEQVEQIFGATDDVGRRSHKIGGSTPCTISEISEQRHLKNQN
jgi:hypothetical protein